MAVNLALPQTNKAPGSDVTYVKGESLSSVEAVHSFVDDFPTVWEESIQVVIDKSREELQEKAKQDPAWRPFADMIDVEFINDAFVYTIADSDAFTAAMEVELGTPESSPNSLFRKYAAATAQEHEELLTNELMGALYGG